MYECTIHIHRRLILSRSSRREMKEYVCPSRPETQPTTIGKLGDASALAAMMRERKGITEAQI